MGGWGGCFSDRQSSVSSFVSTGLTVPGTMEKQDKSLLLDFTIFTALLLREREVPKVALCKGLCKATTIQANLL